MTLIAQSLSSSSSTSIINPACFTCITLFQVQIDYISLFFYTRRFSKSHTIIILTKVFTVLIIPYSPRFFFLDSRRLLRNILQPAPITIQLNYTTIDLRVTYILFILQIFYCLSYPQTLLQASLSPVIAIIPVLQLPVRLQSSSVFSSGKIPGQQKTRLIPTLPISSQNRAIQILLSQIKTLSFSLASGHNFLNGLKLALPL